jgi:hypothetical protein
MSYDARRLAFLRRMKEYVELLIQIENEHGNTEDENKEKVESNRDKKVDGLHPRVSSTDSRAADKYSGWVYRFPGNYD